MRIIPFLISLLLTAGLIYFLDNQFGKIPPLGKFLSPQHGFWQNAEPVDKSFSGDLSLPGLKDRASVYFDKYLIPHVYTNSEADACYIQGYLHAKFRLWQMEFQTFAAAGRLSEVLGAGDNDAILKYDRSMRRLGMVDAAKRAVEEMEKDSTTKKDCDAYTAGVNDYIKSLKQGDLPLEYKLLNYKPEPWSNLKIALFVKYMAFDLAGADNDFEMTNAKSIFSKTDLAKLYPAVVDSADPIIVKGTHFLAPGFVPKAPASADSLYFNNTDTLTAMEMKPEKSNGSNNWAVSGKKTLSGRPILHGYGGRNDTFGREMDVGDGFAFLPKHVSKVESNGLQDRQQAVTFFGRQSGQEPIFDRLLPFHGSTHPLFLATVAKSDGYAFMTG